MVLNKLKSLGPKGPYEGITDDAQRYVERNFVVILLAQLFSKLADTMASAKIVLPWIMSSIGAPTFLTGLLVPIRESGSLLPQIFIGGRIQQQARRKNWYVVGVIMQACCIALIALISIWLRGLWAGVLVVILLALLSLARGVCSLTSKDVLGKTIPEANRGRLMGISASLSGLIGIGLGLSLFLGVVSANGEYWLLLSMATLCWLATAAIYSRVKEFDGETESANSVLSQLRDSMALVRDDPVFRRFVLVRTFMMSSSLCAPYFVLIAQQASPDETLQNLGMFIVVSGIASFISSAIWGRFADYSSRLVLLITGGATSLLCLAATLLAHLSVGPAAAWWAVLLFFLLSVTHQGVRLGRKTYIVDLADGNERTRYVSTSNSIIGALLLVTGVFGAIAAQFSMVWVLLMFAIMASAAVVLGRNLPEATQT